MMRITLKGREIPATPRLPLNVVLAVRQAGQRLSRAVPFSHDIERKNEALRLGRELLRGTKYEQD